MNIIQITDTHIRKDAKDLIYEVNQRNRLIHIVEHIQNQQNHADIIFLTGDISDDGSIESYEFVAKVLGNLKKEIYFIPGNHDNKKNMLSVFSNYISMLPLDLLSLGPWIFVGIDSSVEGRDDGFVSDIEWKKMAFLLGRAENSKKNIVVVTHHHPLHVGTPLIDSCYLQNGADVIHFLQEYKRIHFVMTGHVHNDYSIPMWEAGARLETGPAGCVQFSVGSSCEVDGIDRDRYGYKIYTMEKEAYQTQSVWFYGRDEPYSS